jgi:hypothetical protein
VSSITLIETSSNGVFLTSVCGIREDSTGYSTFPHTYNPATGRWTRVQPPAGYSTVTSLRATDVNSRGQVVGYFSSGGTKGYVWTPDATSPEGGASERFLLNPTSAAPTPAVPGRISDTGHFIHAPAAYSTGTGYASTAADPQHRPLSLLSGCWTNPMLADVNDAGEFVGTVYDPFSWSMKTFLTTQEGFLYISELSLRDFRDGAGGFWIDPPDVDVAEIDWTELDYTEVSYGPNGELLPPYEMYLPDTAAIGSATDHTTGETIQFCRTCWGSVSWWSGCPELWSNWRSLTPSSSPAALNDWGEFAGLYTAEFDEHYDTESNSDPSLPSWEYWSSSASGVFLFDGSYHLNSRALSIHGLSNDPQMLLGDASRPTSLWSDGVTAPFARLFPAGASRTPRVARLADNGIIITQRDLLTIEILSPGDDSDGDGIPDDWEAFHGLDPADYTDAFLDPDGDGIATLGEFRLRSDPLHAPAYDENGAEIDLRPGIDTDGDGIPNSWEWTNGLDYLDPTDAPKDHDRDGYTNLQEFRLDTDPHGAPAYRVREVGPFAGTSSVSLAGAVLGAGRSMETCLVPSAGTLSEEQSHFICFGWTGAIWAWLPDFTSSVGGTGVPAGGWACGDRQGMPCERGGGMGWSCGVGRVGLMME